MIHQRTRRLATTLLISSCLVPILGVGAQAERRNEADNSQTATPIKHVVVIFQENVSFDHYFGTYPHATNPNGSPAFPCHGATLPAVNNLLTGGLLDENPNSAQPFRLDLTPGGNLRSGPRLRRRTKSSQPRVDGQVS